MICCGPTSVGPFKTNWHPCFFPAKTMDARQNSRFRNSSSPLALELPALPAHFLSCLYFLLTSCSLPGSDLFTQFWNQTLSPEPAGWSPEPAGWSPEPAGWSPECCLRQSSSTELFLAACCLGAAARFSRQQAPPSSHAPLPATSTPPLFTSARHKLSSTPVTSWTFRFGCNPELWR